MNDLSEALGEAGKTNLGAALEASRGEGFFSAVRDGCGN
jgi:hypothetical protein